MGRPSDWYRGFGHVGVDCMTRSWCSTPFLAGNLSVESSKNEQNIHERTHANEQDVTRSLPPDGDGPEGAFGSDETAMGGTAEGHGEVKTRGQIGRVSFSRNF